jgi:hypothetical protein
MGSRSVGYQQINHVSGESTAMNPNTPRPGKLGGSYEQTQG